MKISFVSLGCDKNLVDSEIMLGIVASEGYEIIQEQEDADIIIINTCGFILDASQESVDTVLQMAEYKKNGTCKGLIVTGCMAQRYREEIFKELPEVDAVIGTGDFETIGEIIKKVTDGEKVTAFSDINKPLSEKYSSKRILTTPSHFAYLKIAEGCDNLCTYCTIPSIRGKYRSRTMESLIEEAKNLASQGVKELIIIAQDTAKYGEDIYGESQLHILLKKLSEIDEIKWLRIMYCYPEHLTDNTINEMATNPKVCHYIDMPIQHSNDKVLKLMGRRSTTLMLKNTIKKLREKMPDIAIRTTLIVGFPGEGEEEFNSLVEFISEIKFDRLGVFSYSKEEGTPAYKLPNQVEEYEKSERNNKIMECQQSISLANSNKMIGETLEVIIDGYLPEDDVYCGRSFMDSYEVDGMVFFKGPAMLDTGLILPIYITEAKEYDLIGEIVHEFAE